MNLKLRCGAELEKMIVTDNLTIRQACPYFGENRNGIVFVVSQKDGQLLGSVTNGDLRRAFAAGVSPEQCITSITHKNIVYFTEETPEHEIVAKLGLDNAAGQKLYIPVLDAARRVKGYYSYYDVKFIPVAQPDLRAAELAYLVDCVENNWVSSKGKYISRFEELFAEFAGVGHAAAICNGTAALHLALAALEIGPGDEVIVPSLSFIATANAVSYTGATPVFADVEADTWNISPSEIERLISPRTKAIIPVHLYGQPCRMDEINALAQKHGLRVIEDAAEAHGASYKGRPVGQLGDIACFSFFGNKIVTTGEGGMVVTNDEALSKKMRILRDHGMDPEHRYWHPVIGYNYRMTNMQAALGVAQMERIGEILSQKAGTIGKYRSLFGRDVRFELPPLNDWSVNVCWMFSLVMKNGICRDEIIAQLRRKNIETRPFFYPIHTMPPYKKPGVSLPVCERLSARGLNLPSYPGLSSSEIEHIYEAVLGSLEVSAPEFKGSK